VSLLAASAALSSISSTLPQFAAAQSAAALAALLLCAATLRLRPYRGLHSWKTHVGAALLLLTACTAAISVAAFALSRGGARDAGSERLSLGLSITPLVLAVVVGLVLLSSWWRSLLRQDPGWRARAEAAARARREWLLARQGSAAAAALLAWAACQSTVLAWLTCDRGAQREFEEERELQEQQMRVQQQMRVEQQWALGQEKVGRGGGGKGMLLVGINPLHSSGLQQRLRAGGGAAEALSAAAAVRVIQRSWLAFRRRVLTRLWVKIVALDGDVFYKHKISGELAWEVPEPAAGVMQRGWTGLGKGGS